MNRRRTFVICLSVWFAVFVLRWIAGHVMYLFPIDDTEAMKLWIDALTQNGPEMYVIFMFIVSAWIDLERRSLDLHKNGEGE